MSSSNSKALHRPSSRASTHGSINQSSSFVNDSSNGRKSPSEIMKKPNSAGATRFGVSPEPQQNESLRGSSSYGSLHSTATTTDGMKMSRPASQTGYRYHQYHDMKDVSFLSDKPGHGRFPSRREYMDGSIPPSMIPSEYHVIEKSTVPPTGDDYKYEYDDKERVWKITVFPGLRPSSRKEVMLLDKWLNEQLELNIAKHKNPAEVVNEAQQLYSSSFNEIVRQVSVHCLERGRLLAKIWNRYLQLFDIVMELRAQEKEQFVERLKACEGSIQNIKMENENALLTFQLQAQSERRVLLHQQQRLEQQVEKLTSQLNVKTDSERQLKMKLKAIVSWVRSRKHSKEPSPVHRAAGDDFSEEDMQIFYNDEEDKDMPEQVLRVSSLAAKARRASLVTLPTSLPSSAANTPRHETRMKLGHHNIMHKVEVSTAPNSRPASATPKSPPTKTVSIPDMQINISPPPREFRDLDSTSQLDEFQTIVGGVLVPESWLKYFQTIEKDGYQATARNEDWVSSLMNYVYRYIADDIGHNYGKPNRTMVGLVKKMNKLKHQNSDAKDSIHEYKATAIIDRRMSIPDIMYEYFLQLYGLRTIAEMRLLDLLHTVSTLATSSVTKPKVYLFSRFLYLNEPLPRDAVDFYIYASCVLSIPYSRITKPNSSDVVAPFAFHSDELCAVPIAAVKEAMAYILDFLSHDDQSTLLQGLEESSTEKMKARKEISAQLFLSVVVDKWIEKSYDSLLVFIRSARSAHNNQINLDSFIVAMQRFDSTKSRTEIIALYREVLMESQDLGDDLLDEAVDVVFRRHGFIKEPKVGSVPDMVKDDDKEALKMSEFNFLADNWASSCSDLEAYSSALFQRAMVSEQVNNEIQDQIRFITRLITTQADPALVVSSHRMLMIRLYTLPRL